MTSDIVFIVFATGRGLTPDEAPELGASVAGWVAGREKDLVFAQALLDAQSIEHSTLCERVEMLEDVHPLVIDRIRSWLAGRA